MTEHIIRQYKPEDENKIVPFLDDIFSGWPKHDLPCSKVEHWKWKYLDRPNKKIAAIVSEHNNK